MTDSNRITFTFTTDNPGVSSSNSTIKFKKINTDSDLNGLDLNINGNLNIDSYSQLCYLDLTDTLNTNGTYSISFTITENINSDSLKPHVYLTIGKHLKNGFNESMCVFRNTEGRVTLGFSQGNGYVTENPVTFGTFPSEPGVEYIYTLTLNHLALGTDQRIRLYRKRSDEGLDSNNQVVNLIASSDVSPNISIPYVFLGTSYTTLMPGWDSTFDITSMSVKEIKLYLDEAIDPSFLPGTHEYPTTVSVLNTNTTKNTPYAFCEIGDTIELKFHSPRLVSYVNVKPTMNGQQMIYVSSKFISETDDNSNVYQSIEYTFQITITEQYPTNPLQYIVNFNGTLTESILVDNLFVLKTLPTITYEINNVTSSTVSIKLTSISDELYDFYNASYENVLSVTFIASDGNHTTLSVNATTFTIGSIFTIDSLSPVETIWNMSATITDLNISGRTNTLTPTVNNYAVNGNIEQIINGEIDEPEVSNADVAVTHQAGDNFISVLNIKSKDLQSSFSTYAAVFDTNTQTVTIDDIINGGYAMISQLNVPNTSTYVSLDGSITHFRKWNGTGWDPATVLEYNKMYYIYVYSVDLSTNQNANTVFVNSPFVEVYVGYQNVFFDLGLESVPSAHILATFSEKGATDDKSTAYVGYDTSGNNNHLLITLVDSNVSPIVPSNGSINENVLSLENVSELFIPNPDYNLMLPNSSYTISFFIKKINWDDSVIIYDSFKSSEFITINQTNIVINHSSTPSETTVFNIDLSLNRWTSITICFDDNRFTAFIDAVNVVASSTGLMDNYTGISRDLFMTSTNTHIDEFRIYRTKIDIDIIQNLMNTLKKTVEFGFDTEGYVFNYNVIVNNDALQINDDTTLHSFNLNGIYTFHQSSTTNSHPIMLQDSGTGDGDNNDIVYYIDDEIVTKNEYITNFSTNNNRKIVFTPTAISLSSSSITLKSTNTNITPLPLTVVTNEIIVNNKGIYQNPTFESLSYTTDAAVNSLAYRFEGPTSALTLPAAQVSPNLTISTWAKINSLPTSSYPILHQNNVF